MLPIPKFIFGAMSRTPCVEDPDLIVMCGLPGETKSTVASVIAERLDAERIQSDVVRKEIIENPTNSADEDDFVYRDMLYGTQYHLDRGRPVVVDATFSKCWQRHKVDTILDYDATFVHVGCDEEVVERRIDQRETDPNEEYSDVYLDSEETFEPISRNAIRIEDSASETEMREKVAAHF